MPLHGLHVGRYVGGFGFRSHPVGGSAYPDILQGQHEAKGEGRIQEVPRRVAESRSANEPAVQRSRARLQKPFEEYLASKLNFFI